MNNRLTPGEHFALMAASGVIFGIILIVTVFATGQTFGQRCAVAYPDKDRMWSFCVEQMKQGYIKDPGDLSQDIPRTSQTE